MWVSPLNVNQQITSRSEDSMRALPERSNVNIVIDSHLQIMVSDSGSETLNLTLYQNSLSLSVFVLLEID